VRPANEDLDFSFWSNIGLEKRKPSYLTFPASHAYPQIAQLFDVIELARCVQVPLTTSLCGNLPSHRNPKREGQAPIQSLHRPGFGTYIDIELASMPRA